MRFLTIPSLALLLLASCAHEDKATGVLQQPPFQTLTDSIGLQPKNADLYYRRGTLLYANQQNELAISDIRTAFTLRPTEEYALSLTTLLKQKNVDSALVFLQTAVQKVPESIALHIGLARAYQAKGKTKEAQQIADLILEQYPGQLDALTLKSDILGAEKKTTESLAYLQRAYSLVPSDPSLAYDLAFEYAALKDPRARTLTDSLIRANAPEVEKAHYVRGIYLVNTGNSAEALASFDRAIRNNYNFMDAYRDKGQLLYNQRKYAEAIRTYQLALKIAPAEAEFYYLVGQAQQALGQNKEAKQNYERAYGLDKSLTEAREAANKL